jgi:hypothetical protein
MRSQPLKPETVTNLRTVCLGHQYNNFVRVPRSDAIYHLSQGRTILILIGDKAYWIENKEEIKREGLKFVYWG